MNPANSFGRITRQLADNPRAISKVACLFRSFLVGISIYSQDKQERERERERRGTKLKGTNHESIGGMYT